MSHSRGNATVNAAACRGRTPVAAAGHAGHARGQMQVSLAVRVPCRCSQGVGFGSNLKVGVILVVMSTPGVVSEPRGLLVGVLLPKRAPLASLGRSDLPLGQGILTCAASLR